MSQSTIQQRSLLATALSLTAVAAGTVWYWKKGPRTESRNSGNYGDKEVRDDAPVQEIRTATLAKDDIPSTKDRILKPNSITIAHGSVTGTCAKLAEELYKTLQEKQLESRQIQMGALEEWDWWDELLNDDEEDREEISEKKTRR